MERGTWVTRALPEGGAVRVSKDPFALPELSGWSRYDDPDGLYRVRYLGGTLECCLKEVFDRGGRRNDTFESVLLAFAPGASAAVDDLGEDDDDLGGIAMPPGADPALDDVSGWLTALMVGRMSPVRDASCAVTDHEDVLAELDGHPRVRAVLDALRNVLGDRLTRQIVRATDTIVYRVTQAVSSAVHQHDQRFAGVAYQSCVDETEECWGLFDRVSVLQNAPTRPLVCAEHAAAILTAAAYVGLDVSQLGL